MPKHPRLNVTFSRIIRLPVYIVHQASPPRHPLILGSINFSSTRREFDQDDIVLNYRDLDGDLIRLLSDQDIELMVSQSRSKPSEKHMFPWKLHITHKDDFSVYNTSPGMGATHTVRAT